MKRLASTLNLMMKILSMSVNWLAKGILPISNVRISNSKMMGFIKKVHVVPNIILEKCDAFFKKSTKLIKS